LATFRPGASATARLTVVSADAAGIFTASRAPRFTAAFFVVATVIVLTTLDT